MQQTSNTNFQKKLLGPFDPGYNTMDLLHEQRGAQESDLETTATSTATVAKPVLSTSITSASTSNLITVMNMSIVQNNSSTSSTNQSRSIDPFEIVDLTQSLKSQASITTPASESTRNTFFKITKPTTLGGAVYAVIDQAISLVLAHIRAFLTTPVEKSWHYRAMTKLNSADAYLDSKLPNFWIQNKIDKLSWYKTETAENAEKLVQLTDTIEKKFSRLERFDMWVRTNASSTENWYMQLASYLVKLPLRSAMNIVNLLYGVIETILYTAVHPLKSINRILKTIVTLLNELGKPETWTKIGVGAIAMNLGQIAVFTNPVSHMAMAIGGTLMLAGISLGMLKAAIINEGNELGAAKTNLFNQLAELPECFLTAFFMGMITGGIQRATTPRFSSYEEARAYADKYIREHGFPEYQELRLKPNGTLVIDWGSGWGNRHWFRLNHPELFKDISDWQYPATKFKIVIPNIGPKYAVAGGYSDFWKNNWRYSSANRSGFDVACLYLKSSFTGKYYYGMPRITYLWNVKGF